MNIETRKKAREVLFKLIFELLFSNIKPNNKSFISYSSKDFPPQEIEYLKLVYFGIIEKYEELSSIINKHSKGFNYDRIYKTDLAVLLLSTYEMMYIPEIPVNVSISEAIHLVKIYSTEKSSSYVNGILSSINKELNNK